MGEEDLKVPLNINNASYHHSCKNANNNRMHERLIEKRKQNTNAENEDILKSPPIKRRSTVSPNIEMPNQAVCYFCKCIDIQENLVAAGTVNATKTKAQIHHVKNMRANWIEMAKVLEDENLLIQLMPMLLQMRCFIINPTLNVVIKNIKNSTSKSLKRKL